ncbi:egg cell-secreted protein 1.2-like [Salvia splendens]|uniref:egg cell-secreted protein 1.2-like n=1 Tax=Salvia splendens TaxID=180675 RepID=UPI001C27C995|nr:egg cell-secreted protein 1.2-like [Salvia splendens]
MAFKLAFFLISLTLIIPQLESRKFPELEESTGLDCWTALHKIRSCSNEIVAYFASGAIDITPPCCEAIALITHQCWPAVLGVLGYGQDQADVLRGYCDAIDSYTAVPGPAPGQLGLSFAPVN